MQFENFILNNNKILYRKIKESTRPIDMIFLFYLMKTDYFRKNNLSSQEVEYN